MIRAAPGAGACRLWQISNCSLRLAGPKTAAALLDWYDRERRELPWRARPGAEADPYEVWLSEIMLQQTTVGAVIPFYERFLERWPTVEALAAASLDDVLAAWAGLGYYSRARNLHKCAQDVAERASAAASRRRKRSCASCRASAPTRPRRLRPSPSVRATTPVDGNIERVVARLFAVKQPLPAAKAEIRRLARTLTPAERAGDFAQALMDLGASVCTPKRPSCLMCPIRATVRRSGGLENVLPARAAKPERPVRVGLAFVALREDAHVLLRRRPEAGLLGGMLEVPSTDWADTLPPVDGGAARGARARRVVGGAGRGHAHLHALPAGDAGLSRASCRPRPR